MARGPRTDTNAPLEPRIRGVAVAALALALIGLATSVELTRIHYLTHTDPHFHSICALSDAVNCETVAASPFSVFAGAPVSAWGVLGYTAMAILMATGLRRRRLHGLWPLGLLAVFSSLAFLASAALAYISFTRIDSLCLFCMALYGLNTGLLGVAIGGLVHAKTPPWATLAADLGALFERRLLLAALVLGGASAVAALAMGIPPYWHNPRWSELPDLPTGMTPNGHHWMGAADPLVTVVEYSDYQCPFCRKAHKQMRLKAAAFPNEVRLIHRHAPLDQACNADLERPFHERACEFAEAAECAGLQGRFWEMNDALFSVQDSVRTADVDPELLAVRIGIDRSAFVSCMSDGAVLERIQSDLAESRKAGVKGTPTFFIGDQAFPGSIPDGTLEAVLDQRRGR